MDTFVYKDHKKVKMRIPQEPARLWRLRGGAISAHRILEGDGGDHDPEGVLHAYRWKRNFRG